jgi:hypothetical protein
LFPVVPGALSPEALDAALRLATRDGAILVLVSLVPVPVRLPLDAPPIGVNVRGLLLDETIGRRAASSRVSSDPRIERGRTDRRPRWRLTR